MQKHFRRDLNAGDVVTSGNAGITKLAPTTDAAVGATITANTATGVITAIGLAAIINAQMNEEALLLAEQITHKS